MAISQPVTPSSRARGAARDRMAFHPAGPLKTGVRRASCLAILVKGHIGVIGQVQPDRLKLGVLVMGVDRVVTSTKTRLLVAAKGGRDVALAKAVHRH